MIVNVELRVRGAEYIKIVYHDTDTAAEIYAEEYRDKGWIVKVKHNRTTAYRNYNILHYGSTYSMRNAAYKHNIN